jgi:hypothetical protein
MGGEGVDMRKGIAIAVFAVLFVVFFAGCKSPPPPPPPPAPQIIRENVPVEDTRVPLTMDIINRLIGDLEISGNDIILYQYQLHLFGRISMQREYSEHINSRERDGIFRGRANFQNVNTRDEIIVNDQTLGQVLRFERLRDEIRLFVGFDDKEDNTLVFSNLGNPSGFFYLRFNSDTLFGRRIIYGENESEYTVTLTGDTIPYLLIKLSNENVNRLNSQVLPGRRVQ